MSDIVDTNVSQLDTVLVSGQGARTVSQQARMMSQEWKEVPAVGAHCTGTYGSGRCRVRRQ